MKPYSLFALLAAAGGLALLTGGCSDTKSPALDDGVGVFLENDLDAAEPMLAGVVEREPGNADARAWYAECLRRQGEPDKAYQEAAAAVSLDPDHAFAHTVLGDLFSPRLSSWGRVDADSAWYHLLLAVEADHADGNAWSSLWIHSMMRDNADLEHEAAVALLESGFLTPAALAYNRWQLENLPPNAILLTNGDMDTYPAVALQEAEGLREDVAIINLSLLNLPWYVRNRAGKYDLPLPLSDDELDGFEHRRNIDGDIVGRGDRIVAGWLEMQRLRDLDRPLCAAVTVSCFDFTRDAVGRMIYCGSYYEYMPRALRCEADIDEIEHNLSAVRPEDFEGPFASTIDRSPVRRSQTDRIAQNVTAAMLRYVDLLVREGRLDEAMDALVRAEYFDSRISAGGAFEAGFDSRRETIGTTI
jgi:tetratricopeptide (TPR) repeat protein